MTGKLSEIPFSIKDYSKVNPSLKIDDGWVRSLDLESKITKFRWSPILFKGNRRIGEDFLECSWAVLDFDETETPIEQAAKELIDFQYIIGATRSHNPPVMHRYRVCIPYERTITDVREFRHNQRLLVKAFSSDGKCKDPARLYYPCKFLFAVNHEGETLPVLDAPDESEFTHDVEITDPQVMPLWLDAELSQVLPKGDRAVGYFKLGSKLRRAGYGRESTVRIIRARVMHEGYFSEREIIRNIEGGWKAAQKEFLGD